jgi:hypothetical protein
MGLDIRTDQKENMPVYAAADGYIAKISISPFGFGKAIYINHPNGLTTVYGHLNKFFPKLDSLVKAQQYKQQSWEIVIDFAKDRFPVRKGNFIAYSGSTGGSQGPHVHFEVRDTRTERCINPLLFNLPIADAVPPVFTKLALYNKGASVYEQNPTLFPVKKTESGYTLPKNTLIKTGFSRIGFAISAFDRVSGSTNPNGIYSAKIFFDSRPLIEFVFDSMDYNETDYINAHIDYRYHYNSGTYLQQLFKLPGDKGRAYRLKTGDGSIHLNDINVHSIKIEIEDAKGNASMLNFKIQFNDSLSPLANIPHKTFAPNYVNVFEQNDFELYVKENCLYDTIQPVFYRFNQTESNAVSSRFQFCDASIPVHDEINIRIKPNVAIAKELENKIFIKRTEGRNTNYRKATWQKDPISGGWLASSFNDFGSFQAFVDNVPPTINELGNGDTVDLSRSKNIVFRATDNVGVKKFRVELDGQWLMFSNDKGAPWIYYFDEKCPYGVHLLKVRVEDIAGNATEKQWWFKRYPYTPPKKTKSPLHRKEKPKSKASKKK